MSGHLTERQILDFHFGLARPRQAARAADHLAACAVCRARAEQLREKLAALDTLKAQPPVSEQLVADTLRAVRRSAAATAGPIRFPRFSWAIGMAAAAALLLLVARPWQVERAVEADALGRLAQRAEAPGPAEQVFVEAESAAPAAPASAPVADSLLWRDDRARTLVADYDESGRPLEVPAPEEAQPVLIANAEEVSPALLAMTSERANRLLARARPARPAAETCFSAAPLKSVAAKAPAADEGPASGAAPARCWRISAVNTGDAPALAVASIQLPGPETRLRAEGHAVSIVTQEAGRVALEFQVPARTNVWFLCTAE
jgi:hypothetical protein